jgi:hypothetical protein
MQTIKLTNAGMVSLPSSMLRANAWAGGTEFTIENIEGKVVLTPLTPVKSAPKTRIEDLIGCMGYVGKKISVEEMNEAIIVEVKTRHARS